MRTEKEIRERLERTQEDLRLLEKIYEDGSISKEQYERGYTNISRIENTLLWVLEER